MTRKTGWTLAAAIVALALVVSETAAWGGLGRGGPAGRGGRCGGAFCMGPEGAGFDIERMAARLDLAAEQKEMIEKIRSADEKKLLSLHKEMMLARHDLRGEMMKDEPDASKVKKIAEKMGGIRTSLQIARLESRIAVRKILTPEQRDKMLLAPHCGFGCWCGTDFDDEDPRPERTRFHRFEGQGRGARPDGGL